MTKRWLGVIAGLAVSAGSALGQAPTPAPWVRNLSPYSETPDPITQTRYVEAAAPMPNPVAANTSGGGTCADGTCGESAWFDAEYLLWKLKAGHTAQFPLFGGIPAAL